MDGLICEVCQKKFSSVSSRNRHLRDIHKKVVAEKKSQHVLCPLCPEEKKDQFSCHEDLTKHITNVHNVNIKESVLCFRSLEEFEDWRMLDNREVNYACHRRKKNQKGDEYIYYNCNRSDSKGDTCLTLFKIGILLNILFPGFSSVCKERNMKTGGSIRISGICPARMLVKIVENGV